MYRREYLKVLEWVLRVSGIWLANVYRSATVCATMAIHESKPTSQREPVKPKRQRRIQMSDTNLEERIIKGIQRGRK